MVSPLVSGLILFFVFGGLLVLGMPIAIAIVVASLSAVMVILPPDVALFTAAQKMAAGLDSFSLLAVPFFLLSGSLMNFGGIAVRLVNLSKLITGRIPGSLAHTNIVGNMLFGSISGSSIAASTAIGGVMIPLEVKEGYDRSFAAAANIASAPTGMLIPPTASFIIYSLIAGGTSIAALFLGGYVIGILWGLGVMAMAFFIAKKRRYPVSSEKIDRKTVIKTLIQAIPSVLLIIIVIGGIVTGIFTAIEGAAVSVAYTLFLTLVFYRSIKIKDLPRILMHTVEMTGSVMLLIAASASLSFVMAFTGIPAAISQFLLGVSDNKYVILFIINIILLFAGTFMDVAPAILIFTPIFLPVATSVGVDPLHFGLIFIYNLCIGTITPPVGNGLFVGAKVAGMKFEQLIKPLLPFYLAIIAVLFLITYIPAIPLFLPKLFGY